MVASSGAIYDSSYETGLTTGLDEEGNPIGYPYDFIGSPELDLSKTVELSNSLNGGEAEVFTTEQNAKIAEKKLNSTYQELYDVKFSETAIGWDDTWGFATYALNQQFENVNLGKVKLSPGTNNIKIKMKDGYDQYGNWYSITASINN